MGITSGLIRVTIRFMHLAQQCEYVGYYFLGGAAWLTANRPDGAEAYWNNIKDRWRALYPASTPTLTSSVLFEELGGSLSFGEFAVPSDEQHGTRSLDGFGNYMPAYTAVGIRLSVASRTTRPG